MIKEIKSKTALSPSRLPGLDYALNPYKGCEHACVYCYAPSVIHWNNGKWGENIEIKINLPRILSKELNLKKKGVVGLGTSTDPYQPLEKKYEITRRCLELLLMHDFPVCLQTKSSLVLRDIDILKEFSKVEVGVTITALNENVRKNLEHGAGSIEERLYALRTLRESGISTWVFIGPVMPFLTEAEELIDTIAAVKPDYVLIDRLRLRDGIWNDVMEFIKGFDKKLFPEYERIFFGSGAYYEELFEKMISKYNEKGIRCEVNALG
jgi:DNA repair photolyase